MRQAGRIVRCANGKADLLTDVGETPGNKKGPSALPRSATGLTPSVLAKRSRLTTPHALRTIPKRAKVENYPKVVFVIFTTWDESFRAFAECSYSLESNNPARSGNC